MKLDLSKNSDNLRSRLIYGFLGFFMMMGGMLWNEWTYFFVFLVICTVCLMEFFRLLKAEGKRPLQFFGVFAGVLLYVLSALMITGQLANTYFFLLYPIFALVFILKLYDKSEKQAFESIGLTTLGIAYIAFPFSALNFAVFSQGFYSYQIIVGTFFLIWINDITAYFIGSGFGKTKLFARISPKKSWEGSTGGFIACSLMVVLLSQYFRHLSWAQWAGVAFIVVVAGTYGDLVESMFKRSIQVKDSGSSIPGHGGFLDRFDGLLLAAPFIAAFLKFF
ncbi:MAG: phosphatidate cytidylyltransferase [Microscillaceae bacterium]|jgi:phosphatidate cytidylyltransferase|nr:phosphatidate cytidylyltransferase [Microscillaceae bacterium]